MSDLANLGAKRRGVWSRREALAVVTPGQIDAALRSGTWQAPWPGVYADNGFALDPVQEALAAVLASAGRGAAYACARTAARVWGLPLIDDDDPATGAREANLFDVGVTRHVGNVSHGDKVLRRHQLTLSKGDLVRHNSGLLLTSRLRTLVDCARLLPLEAVVCCIDAALNTGAVTGRELADAVERRKGTAGAPRLREALALSDGRAQAPSETLLRLVLLPHFPALVPQVELFDDAVRLIGQFDLADEAARVAVEADGKRGHAGDAMVAKDRKRDWRSRQRGWVTERFTWFEIRRRRAEVLARVGEAYEQQRRVRVAA